MTEQVTAEATDAAEAFDAAFAAHAREYGDEVDVDEALADVNTDDDAVDGTDGESLEDALEDSDEDNGPADEAASQHPIEIRGDKPGFDEVLKWMGQEWPEGAAVAKEWQSNMSRDAGANNELREQMLSLVQEMQDLKAAQAAPVSEEPTEAEQKIYSEEQAALLAQWAADNGFVRKDDLEAEKQYTQAITAEHRILAEGVEQYGDAFGTLNPDGTVDLSEDLKQQLQPIMQRIDEQGVTALDMVRMAGLLAPVETAESPETDSDQQPPAPARSREALSRANTARRPSGAPAGGSTPQISFEGDDAEDVFNRAYAVAKKALQR